MTKLTHLDANGAAAMVDVSDKDITQRVAVAEGVVIMAPATLALIHSGNAKKGDVLGVARLAGIMGAKKTSDLIPLCHPIALTRVAVDFEVLTESAEVLCTATAQTVGQTGVEMEALAMGGTSGPANWTMTNFTAAARPSSRCATRAARGSDSRA